MLPCGNAGPFIRRKADINRSDPALGDIFIIGRELKMQVEFVGAGARCHGGHFVRRECREA
jgi:hypothetical protein